jgi:hypothetical protein
MEQMKSFQTTASIDCGIPIVRCGPSWNRAEAGRLVSAFSRSPFYPRSKADITSQMHAWLKGSTNGFSLGIVFRWFPGAAFVRYQ